MEKPAETITPKEKRSIPWTGFIVWPFVFLLLYALSFGPVWMMIDKGRISRANQLVSKFYAPVWWAYMETPLHKPLGIYFHLWEPEVVDKDGDIPYVDAAGVR